MTDDAPLNDALSPVLTTALNAKLQGDEDTLVTLAGAHGEGLAVTDRRVVILREQMPTVGGDTEVDCFDYSYEQIRTVRLDAATGGDHLRLVLYEPPPDEQRVTLYVNAYDAAKFEIAAARIRMLLDETRKGTETMESRICAKCGQSIGKDDLFCAACGTAQGSVCGYCQSRLEDGARFCTRCGAPAENGRALTCPGCDFTVAPFFVFCPQCGRLLGSRCRHCGAPVTAGWSRCAACGRNLDAATTTPAGLAVEPSAPASAPANAQTAEEHNARGMRLYENEQYDEAIAAFQKALDLAPGTALFHCNLAVALAESGDDDAAMEEYQTAIKLAPNDPVAYLNLGYYYSEREMMAEAQRMWRRAVEVAPQSAEAEEARQNLDNTQGV